MNTRLVAAALLLATLAPVTLQTRTSFAQQAPDDPSTKAARARFQEGVAFYDKGQYDNARAAFLQAYALRKHPAVLLNLAQSSLRSGHALEAANFFGQYLHDSTALTAAQRGDAEKGLAEARTKIGRIEVTAPAGAEITVDNDRIGVAPLAEPVDVEPGPHKVTMRNPDGTSDAKAVTVAQGQQGSARFTAQTPTPPVSPVATPTPETPPEPTAPPPTEEPTAPKQPEPVHKSSGPTLVPSILGLVLSAGGIVTAVVLANSKSSAQNSATSVSNTIVAAGGGQGTCFNTPPTSRFYNACNTLAANNNKVNADATGANVGIAAGIVGVVFAVGWYVLAPRRHQGDTKAATTTFAPFVGPHTGGMGLGTSF